MSDIRIDTDDFQEHLSNDDKSQEVLTTLTGLRDPGVSKEAAVEVIAQQRHLLNETIKQLAATLNAAGRTVQRVSGACGEVLFRTIEIPLDPTQPAVKLVNYNYERSRLLVIAYTMGANPAYLSVGTDPNLSLNLTTGDMPMNGMVLAATPFTLAAVPNQLNPVEIKTVRDIYARVSTPNTQRVFVSVMEEFVA